MKSLIISIILFCLTALSCHAQSCRLFTTERELSSSMINQVYQDSKGFIWIATEDGLNRYDGAKFTIYKNNRQDTTSLVNNYVRTLFEDSKGRLFIGTLSGLQIYDYEFENFRNIPILRENQTDLKPSISSIIELKDGTILLGTSGYGIHQLLPGEEHTAPSIWSQKFAGHVINHLITDQNGKIWIATENNGMIMMDAHMEQKQYGLGTKNAYQMINCCCQDAEGNIYAGTTGRGLFMYDPQQDKFVSVYSSHMRIKTLLSDKTDRIYIGIDGGGIKTYNTHLKQIKDATLDVISFDLNTSKVHSILKDNNGNLWLGIFQKGVAFLPAQSNNFHYIGHRSSLYNNIGSNCITAISKDQKGTFYVGTDNDGLYNLDANYNLIRHYKPTDSPNAVPSTIMSLYTDSKNNVWIGSYLNGMSRFNPQTGKCEYFPLTDQSGNKVERVYCFAEDKDNYLWIGTMGNGLYRLNLKALSTNKNFQPENLEKLVTSSKYLANPWINCLLYTHDGKLYIGTFDGIGCIEPSNIASSSTPEKFIKGAVINTMYEDKGHLIWVGTTDGLKAWNPATKEIKEYTTSDGLPSNMISAIQQDLSGNLWISTNQGLAQYNAQADNFIAYRTSDELQNNEFSRGASYMDYNGELIFGGTNGITYFNPSEISTPCRKSQIRITGFYLHNQSIKKGSQSGIYNVIDTAIFDAREFELCHKDNAFTIEFATYDFSTPENYLYSMNNSAWTSLKPGVNQVSFSALPAGTYTFKVKARNYDTDSDIKTVIFHIHPAWYASGWAIFIYTLIGIGIIIFILLQIRHRYQTRQEMLKHIHAEEINEAKLQFFINISHEIRTPMTLILSPLQKLIATDPDAGRQKTYNLINRNAERILNLVNQLMDIRKIDKGQMKLMFQEVDLVKFINEIEKYFSFQANSKHITLKVLSDNSQLPAWIDPKNFDKVILNLLSNAFKFTPERGEITIQIREGESSENPLPLQHYIEITVEDNGIGINENEISHVFERFYQIRDNASQGNKGTGIGLHLTRSLVELHHGTIEAVNNIDKPGCRFIIRIPQGRNHLNDSEIIKEKQEALNHSTSIAPQPVSQFTDEEPEKNGNYKSSTILIVEDNEEIRNYLSNELKTSFRILTACNGKEALEIIFQQNPHLIISDVMMPEMDGITLLQKIKQNIKINHLPVILLTAKNQEEDNLEGLSCGADAYITKPFSIEIVRKTAENLIKTRSLLRNNFNGNQEQDARTVYIQSVSPDQKLMERVMKVINDNISNPNLNVEMIAAEAGISRVHLYRKLKELTNQSTRELIRNIRLKQAAALLSSDKSYNISDVAFMVGYMSTTHFSNSFKELYGITPIKYAEMHSKEQQATKEEVEQSTENNKI